MNKITIRGVNLTPHQADVYSLIDRYGPVTDAALVPLAQHLAEHQASSGIRTRRNELQKLRLVKPAGEERMPSGRKAVTFEVTA